MTEWDILLWTVSHRKYSTLYCTREEDNLLHNTLTQCDVYYTIKLQVGIEPCLKYWSLERVLEKLSCGYCYLLSYCFLAWSVFVEMPSSIFSDPVLSGQLL